MWLLFFTGVLLGVTQYTKDALELELLERRREE